MAIGTVHTSALLAIAPLALVAGIACLWVRGSWRKMPTPALLAGALALYSALQAIPLPLGLVDALSPTAGGIWNRAHGIIGESGGWVSLSVEPGASLREALKWLTYAAVLTGAIYVGKRRGARWLIGMVFASAAIVAAIALSHRIFGAETLYGVYKPLHADKNFLGPLLNPNNLGGYAAMGGLTGVGLLLASESKRDRLMALVGTAVCVAVIPATLSRGAILTLIVGLSVFATWWALRARGGGRLPSGVSARIVVALTILSVIWGFIAIHDMPWLPHLDYGDAAKLRIGGQVRATIAEYPWFGIGRGAFSSVSAAYIDAEGRNAVFAYAENFPLQWTIEWGLPAAIAALVGFGWLFRPSRMALHRGAGNVGAYIGVGVLLLQNLVDLALEVPAVCYAVAVTLGALWGEGVAAAQKNPARDRTPRALGASKLALVSVLSVTILGSTAAWGRLKGPDYHSDLFDAQGELDPREPRETAAFKQLVAQTVKARPADAYAYKMAATAAARSGDPTELRWLNQALRQSPTDGATHLLAAGALARRNQRDQALMQLRLAVEHAPRLKVDAAKRAIQWTQDHAALMRSVPSGTEGVPVLEELTRLTKGVLRNRLATESLRRRETDVAHVALGAALLDAAQQGRAPCDERRDRCLDTANHHSKRAMSLKPNSPSALRLRVRIIEEREGVAAVEPYLRKQCKELVTSRQCESLRLDYGFRLGVKTATAAATDALSSACMEAVTDCARVAENLRARAAKLGYHHLAFTYAWRAALSAPNAFTWASAAGAALRAERPERALQAARRARVFGSDDPEWKKRIMSIEKRAMLQTYVRD